MPQPLYRYVEGPRGSELEQSVVRIVVGVALLSYFAYIGGSSPYSSSESHADVLTVTAIFLGVALSISVCIVLGRGDVPARRIASIVLDVGALSYVFLIGGIHAAPLYFLYQWIIIGYGFRFGKKYLFIALALSLIGFGWVIVSVPYWISEPGLSIGLWVGTLLISTYFSTLVGRLYKVLEHAEVANNAKRQFICAVSHELRTPLNAIIGMVDLMKSTKIDREQTEMLDCMTTTSQVMLSQIEDVLDFSKIEAGKMSINYTTFDLYQLVQSILDIFRYRIDPLAIELMNSTACDVPYLVKGDPHHLRQILVNLLGNSVKFTEQGRISLCVRLLFRTSNSVRLRFSVKDTGIGIPLEAQSRIFDSFTQAEETIARRYGGTGLGTTISKQLVELMGGEIGFQSVQGQGSDFWFELDFGLATVEDLEKNSLAAIQVRSIIISAEKNTDDLLSHLTNCINNPPVLASDFYEATDIIGQSILIGKPIRLILIQEPTWSELSPDKCETILRQRILSIREVTNDMPVTLVLISQSGSQVRPVEEVAEKVGFSVVLHLPVDIDHLNNILHAHFVISSRDTSKKFIPFAVESDLSLPTTNLDAKFDDCTYRVLVAEDNPTNRKVIQKILERAGHHCTLAKDGEDALDKIEKKEFDAIILDMNMPGMTGMDVARVYRLMRGNMARAPIIMFSANVTTEARDESIEAGADEFLPKPIQVNSFLQTLQQLVTDFKMSGPPENRALLPKPKNKLKLLRPTEAVLDLQNLSDLENVSKDPKFLDDLILEFISENRNLLRSLEIALSEVKIDEIKEILHTLKGSALSIGAVSLKMMCKRVEKLNTFEMGEYSSEISQEMKTVFSHLCEELEKYRQLRRQVITERD
ncbi:hybrid sensory histidine kinase BarA [Oxalobacteraceae bacterium]